jgi:diguanylate cyclase (GGDEF)-like protein
MSIIRRGARRYLVWAPLIALCTLVMLLSSPVSASLPSHTLLTLDGTEQGLDLQPWMELRRTRSDTSFEEILSGPGAWTSASNYSSMHFGYSSDVLWMKIDIASAAQREMIWHLYFPYSSLSRVALFESGQPERLSGLGVPLAQRDFVHRNPVFTLRLAPGEQKTLYLSAKSVGNLGITSQIWNSAAFASHSVSSTAMIMLYCGLILGLGLLYLSIGGLQRKRYYVLYGSYLLFFVLSVTAFSGLGGRYLWPQVGEWGTRLLPFALTAGAACVALLLRDLFTRANRPDVWRSLLTILAITSSLMALGGFFLFPAWISRAMPWLALLITLLSICCIVRAIREQVPAASLFLLGAGLMALSIALFALRATGIVPGYLLTDLAVQGSSAAGLLVVAIALSSRTHAESKQQLYERNATIDGLQNAHAATQQQLLESTQQLEDVKAQLRNMALKDPLTGMSNRAALDLHINQTLRRSKRRHTPLAVMLIDMDGFKQLNDQLGDDTGDRIICAVAKRLAEVARETDFVARLGGNEFVLVADDVSDTQQAQLIAERLLDTFTPNIELDDQSISLGINIGVTLTHAAELDMPTLLRQADMARYSRKRSGRGGVSFHSPADTGNRTL